MAHLQERGQYVFNFKEEIVAYCRSDVDILRRCVAWNFAICFTTSPASIRLGRLPSPRPAISCIAPTTFPKIRLASFHQWDIGTNLYLRTNGCGRTKSISNTYITVVSNAKVAITTKKCYSVRSPRLFLAWLSKMLRPRYSEPNQRYNNTIQYNFI